ncbi:hypothetical protein [Burkholderia pseudomultivorans]|uniref:hypothetical protein n=1 Tax=Burkholderia pseudomultivorans TaxID=1207504 RepID=UPI001E5A5ED3|nr:hypothetical protein [Burkholderia pseudomultivorans]
MDGFPQVKRDATRSIIENTPAQPTAGGRTLTSDLTSTTVFAGGISLDAIEVRVVRRLRRPDAEGSAIFAELWCRFCRQDVTPLSMRSLAERTGATQNIRSIDLCDPDLNVIEISEST